MRIPPEPRLSHRIFGVDQSLEMQQEQPQFYATLAGTLSAADQGTIQTVIVKADEIAAQQAQQAQILAQQQGSGTPTPTNINGGA